MLLKYGVASKGYWTCVKQVEDDKIVNVKYLKDYYYVGI